LRNGRKVRAQVGALLARRGDDANLPRFLERRDVGVVGDECRNITAHQTFERRRAAAIGNMHQVDIGATLEVFHAQVAIGANALGAVTQWSVLCPGESDEILGALDAERGVDRKHWHGSADHHDRREVREPEIQLLDHERRRREWSISGHEQREAIGRRAHDGLRRHRRIAADPILNDDRLAPFFRQPLPDDARQRVGHAACGHVDDETNVARRILMGAGRLGTQDGTDRQAEADCDQVSDVSC
jgi:hypothetical protein